MVRVMTTSCVRSRRLAQFGAGAGGHRDRGLGQAADDQEAAEHAAQNIGGPVSDELLVRIDVAAALHGRSLCPPRTSA